MALCVGRARCVSCCVWGLCVTQRNPHTSGYAAPSSSSTRAFVIACWNPNAYLARMSTIPAWRMNMSARIRHKLQRLKQQPPHALFISPCVCDAHHDEEQKEKRLTGGCGTAAFGTRQQVRTAMSTRKKRHQGQGAGQPRRRNWLKHKVHKIPKCCTAAHAVQTYPHEEAAYHLGFHAIAEHVVNGFLGARILGDHKHAAHIRAATIKGKHT